MGLEYKGTIVVPISLFRTEVAVRRVVEKASPVWILGEVDVYMGNNGEKHYRNPPRSGSMQLEKDLGR